MKRILKLSLAFLLILAMVSATWVFATNHDKLKDVNRKLNNTRKELREGKRKEKNLTNQIVQIQENINKEEGDILKLEKSIKSTTGKIVNAQVRLNDAQNKVNKQQDDLSKRLRSMYMNDGSASIIEVVFGSEDIVDFMSNMDMVKTIYENDSKLLNGLKDNRDAIEKERKYLADLQQSLENQQSQHENKKYTLAQNKQNVTVLKNQVAADNKKLSDELDNLNREANRLTAEVLKLQSKGTSYKGGVFMWPVSGRISSPFGYRLHPILKQRKLHTGLDISAPSGTPVKAANSGTVIKSGYAGSYGNMVMIDHGGGIVTLYAHNSRLAVGTGTKVQKGQVISYVGSTGRSTGPHLHFEVRVNGHYKNPMGWL